MAAAADNITAVRPGWPGLSAIASKGKESVEQKYYIISKQLSSEEALHAFRSHWGVESIYWMLDAGFREDNSRARKGNSAENLAVMRQLTLNILKKDKNCKLGIKNKRLNSAYSLVYLELIMASISA
ncbi:ISAs1 family transposase [Sinobacterium caligoides]|uniref:ISAs1 family transposase n=1 Tax=Sinobacterium caligoides TaxID=933926 RepID=UPI0013C2FA26|nr:ISAs1 family transposase [Sinobacterium caligoides]